jgi:5-methylcytosine-specific restriction protein A
MPRESAEIINELYQLAIRVLDGELTISAVQDLMAQKYRTNKSSCQIYLNNIRRMLAGDTFKRTMSASATDALLKNILQTRTVEEYVNSLNALEKHIEYFENHYSTTMSKMRIVLNSHSHQNNPLSNR